MPITVNRKSIRFYPNNKRVIAQTYMPCSDDQAKELIQKIIDMPEDEHQWVFNKILRNFSKRHRNISKVFEKGFQNIRTIIHDIGIDADTLPIDKKLIIGAYFTKEYSIESSAFFNPSIVEDPYQGDLENGQKRVIISFRATGEGHISSIAFRSGIIDSNHDLTFQSTRDIVDAPEVVTRHVYEKKTFLRKLDEMNIKKDVITVVMDQLDDHFIYGELQAAIENVMEETELSYTRKQVVNAINWLATSHYEVTFSLDTAISERILSPISYAERNGIEDARFVKFVDDKGKAIYYATYTAYNGFSILSKLIETKDFYHFKVVPLHGKYVKSKGMALFPRKIKNRYAMLSRIDGSNNYIMFSNNINLWQDTKIIHQPRYPWELVQVGNAGSPIETKYGWLVITHGVGPMRTYSLGAVLLDLDDPTKIIGSLKEPLLTANEEEREGAVPNVVYSCGSIIHNNALIIPYAISDYASTFASVPLEELFDELLS